MLTIRIQVVSLIVLLGVLSSCPTVFAQPSVEGQWSGVQDWPIEAVHTIMLPTGKVMAWQTWQTSSVLWDPVTGAFEDSDFPSVNIFCSAHTWLPDGRLFVAGGQRPEGSLWGEATADIYDPWSGKWASQDPAVPDVPPMNLGRWYPSATTLGNGDILVASGYFSPSPPFPTRLNPLPQVYEYQTNTWRDLTDATQHIPEYPRMMLAPDGDVVLLADFNSDSQTLDVTGTGQWSFLGDNLDSGLRDYGPAVMYDAGKVAYLGGGGNPTQKVNLLDLNEASPQWTYGADDMAQPRRQNNATILADGTVLITGGTSAANNDPSGSVTTAEIWDPVTQQVTQVATASSIYRGYHSTATLLPDGSVLIAGGEHNHNQAGPFVQNTDAEIFEPAYMHNGARPTITDAPDSIGYGETFFVETPDSADIARALMVVPSSTTHSQNWSQRANRLDVTQSIGGVEITFTSNSNEAPPGDYMLFLIDGNGVPSVASYVRAAFALTGDFDADGDWDIDDLNNLLSIGPIAPGVVVDSMNDQFDLTGDGVIDLADRDEWLAIAGAENGFASPYKLGDASLDGVVNGQDFIHWNNSKFSQSLLWGSGDWNGDGFVNGADFILWNGNKFTSSDIAAVPEPKIAWPLLGLLPLLGYRQRQRQRRVTS